MASAMAAIPGSWARDPSEPELFLPATLVRVVDGDTMDVSLASGPITIRLHGIDAPERDQPLGPTATKALRSLVEGQPLEIEPIEQSDAYGRMVAKVFVDGADVNAHMVETGYAWAYRRYLRREPGDETYCRLEAGARAAGRGLWVGSPEQWDSPWNHRARQHGKAVPHPSYATETPERCLAAFGEQRTGSADSGSAASCQIKGNINTKGVRIYHEPGMASYASTRIDLKKGERWFCSVTEAKSAGWRPPK